MLKIQTLAVLGVIGFSTYAFAASDSAVYVYDSYNRLQSVTYANGTTITYNYDSAGNRSSVVTSCSSNNC